MNVYVERWLAQLVAIILFIAGFVLGILINGNCQVSEINPHKFFVEGNVKELTKELTLEFGDDAIIYYDSGSLKKGVYVKLRNTVLHREAINRINKIINHETIIDSTTANAVFFRLREERTDTLTSAGRRFYN